MPVSALRHLLHIFPTFAVGGSQTRFAQLVGLHGKRYRHTVISLDGVQTMAVRLPEDLAVDCVPGSFRTKSPAVGIARALRGLAQYRPDVLVTYNWGSLDWCIAQRFWPGLRHVHIEDGFGPEERTQQLPRRGLLRRLVLAEPNTAVVVPSRTLESIALTQWRLPRDRLRYIPNGVDCGRFVPGCKAVSDDGGVTIGTVATLRVEKNLGRLIRLFCVAAAQRPPGFLKLVIVGDGPERAELETVARNSAFSWQIVFAGATNQPEVPLAQMDVFALTSDTEQMPLSVLEAMAMGLPVVSFDVGDVSNMVAPENMAGVSFRLDDDAAYVRYLLELADNAQLRRQLGARNRDKAEAVFDQRVMAAAYAELFG